ncbi:MAG: peptidoglycan bridge formation glycyltransferase FemA/FemB family protein [Sedimentisphaerales bacterium]|nr:peptidoglycan bridge formation glycyltransferase FemA/FemB family protein [Sedimentisphaerales bacterium]
MNYTIEIYDRHDEKWDRSARDFRDYTIYQTWAYQSARAEKENLKLSGIIIRNSNQEAVLMAVVRLKRIPVAGLRIAYIQWGPLIDHTVHGRIVTQEIWKLLRDAYIPLHADVLRIVPNCVLDPQGEEISSAIGNGGFGKVTFLEPYRSIYVPIDGGEEAILEGFHKSWRRTLKKARKNPLEIREGNDPSYFDILKQIYAKTIERKGFRGLDPDVFIQAHRALPETDKMHIVIAYSNGEAVTAHASSFLGEMGEGILAGSTEQGIGLNSSYLVWWQTLLAAHRAGMKIYNLGGIDPKDNPSVCQFKQRMGGKEIFHIGTFEAARSASVRMLWRGIERIYRCVARRA